LIEREDTAGLTRWIEDDSYVLVVATELLEKLEDRGVAGDKPGRVGGINDPLGVFKAEEVSEVDDGDDVVGVTVIDRDERGVVNAERVAYFGKRGVRGNHLHFGKRDHQLARIEVFELENVASGGVELIFANFLLFKGHFDLFAGEEERGFFSFAHGPVDEVGESVEGPGNGSEKAGEEDHERNEGHGRLLGMAARSKHRSEFTKYNDEENLSEGRPVVIEMVLFIKTAGTVRANDEGCCDPDERRAEEA
jgi:hypothetical protein